MADDNETLVRAVKDQVNQTARVAYAIEVFVRMHLDVTEKFANPCRTCGCRLVPVDARVCPACGE